MLRLLTNSPTTKFIVLGIHAAQEFYTKREVYEFHDFLCTCARLADQSSVQPEYHNYMDKASMVALTSSGPCQPGSDTWVYHKPWWEHACNVITCAAAAQLLQEVE
jgi:hypothetical protein